MCDTVQATRGASTRQRPDMKYKGKHSFKLVQAVVIHDNFEIVFWTPHFNICPHLIFLWLSVCKMKNYIAKVMLINKDTLYFFVWHHSIGLG